MYDCGAHKPQPILSGTPRTHVCTSQQCTAAARTGKPLETKGDVGFQSSGGGLGINPTATALI